MSRNSQNKLVVAACCPLCGIPLPHIEGLVETASYGRCCSKVRRKKASEKLGLGPITFADFDGSYLIRRDR